MTALARVRARLRRQEQSGFTFPEVVISVVLLTMITGALSAAFVTSMRMSVNVAQRAKEANDTQLIAAFLVRDAQAAGTTDPTTGALDPSYGVSLTDSANCSLPAGATQVARFKWLDRIKPITGPSPTKHVYVAVYSYVPSTTQIVRTLCVDPAPPTSVGSSVTLAHNIPTTPSAECDPVPDCSGQPLGITVHVTVTEKANQTTQQFDFTANLRPEVATTASAATSLFPLLLLGSPTGCILNGTMHALGDGQSDMRIWVGGSAAADTFSSGCTAVDVNNTGVQYKATTDATWALNGANCDLTSPTCSRFQTSIADPYTNLVPPPNTGSRSGCGGGPGVYAATLTISGNCTLASGVYILQRGLRVNPNATLTSAPGGVLLYITGDLGTGESVSIDQEASVTLSALTPVPYLGMVAGMVVWQAAAETGTFSFGDRTDATFDGTVYLPRATIEFSDTAYTEITRLVAQRANWKQEDGDTIGGTVFGTPPPPPSITGPSTLPDGVAGQAYPGGVTITALDGIDPKTWSATGLPSGMNINPVTGVISGTPGNSGTVGVTVTVTDFVGRTGSRSYSLTIRPSITSVLLENRNGSSGIRRIQEDDRIVVTFSSQMSVSSFCPSWSGDNNDQSLDDDNDNVVVTVINGTGGANDSISVNSGACGVTGFHLGTIDLDSTQYVSGGNVTFGDTDGNDNGDGDGDNNNDNSTIRWDESSHRLRITLGNQGPGSVNTVPGDTAPVYTASVLIVDTTPPTGLALGNSPFILLSGPQF